MFELTDDIKIKAWSVSLSSPLPASGSGRVLQHNVSGQLRADCDAHLPCAPLTMLVGFFLLLALTGKSVYSKDQVSRLIWTLLVHEGAAC